MVRLPYGNRYLDIKIPVRKNIEILMPKRTTPIADPRRYAHRKLSGLLDKKGFFSECEDKKVCLVVSDKTRFAFNDIITPILLRKMTEMGVRKHNITILVATGLHAPMSHHDLVENIGKEVVENFKIQNHDPNRDLVSLGATERGTPLFVNKYFMEAELKIATGIVAPHFHAGFGGGCKSILPGICGRDTILRNHRFDMIADGKSRYGVLDGNPVYEDITEAGLKSGLNLIVNVAIDSDKRMTHLFVGEPQATHRKAARKIAEETKVRFRGLFDIVVTTNGGYPLDRNLYQCAKGAAIAELLVKPGGTIVIASECRDGVAHRIFQQYMSHGKTPDDVLDKLRKDEPVDDQDNIQIFARVLARAKVIIATAGVKARIMRQMKMHHALSVKQALRMCGWPVDKRLRIAIVPSGPYVLPVGA